MFDLIEIITACITNALTLFIIIGVAYFIFNNKGLVLFRKNNTVLWIGKVNNISTSSAIFNLSDLEDELSDDLKEEIKKSEKNILERKNIKVIYNEKSNNDLISHANKIKPENTSQNNVFEIINNIVDDVNNTGQISIDKKQDINKILKNLSVIDNEEIKILTNKVHDILDKIPLKKECEILVEKLDEAKASVSEEEKLLLSTLDEIQ